MAEVQTNPSHVAEDININLGNVEIFDDVSGLSADVALLGAANRLRVETFGGGGVAPINTITPAAPGSVSVPNADTPLVGANATRRYLAISVISAGGVGNRITLNISGGAAVLDTGITIFVGTTYIFDVSGIPLGAIRAISNDAVGITVGVQDAS